MEIFKNIATVVGCISACIALAITIFKPLRQQIIDSVISKSQYQRIADNITKINKKIDELLVNNTNMQTRIERIEKNVLANEADRIRAELFDCGNRCRRGIRLHPEEFDHIKSIYDKYTDVLHQNHEGEIEFKFIYDYYNHQNFPAYHTNDNN